MRPEIFSLAATHFYNLCQVLKNQTTFSDARKNHFRGEMVKMSEHLIQLNFLSMTPAELGAYQLVLSIFMSWAQALDSRNYYTLSHEMRGVMDNLCSKWVDDYDKFLFAATDGSFAIEYYNADWGRFIDTINRSFRVAFSHQLFTFKVPKHLYDDFLFNGSIYHEMGHFVDNYYYMSDRIAQKMIDRLNNGQEVDRIKNEFYPIIKETYDINGVCINEDHRKKMIEKQTAEYIADMFGTQYLGEHIWNYIEYIAHGIYDQYDREHPSPNCRKNLELAFLNDVQGNFLLEDIKEEFNATGRPLQKRFVILADASSLMKGQPVKIMNDDELHSLFMLGWEVYLKGPAAYDSIIGNTGKPTSREDFYVILNNAIRQSIANYIK